jgi:hypothetical protein
MKDAYVIREIFITCVYKRQIHIWIIVLPFLGTFTKFLKQAGLKLRLFRGVNYTTYWCLFRPNFIFNIAETFRLE